MQEGPLPAGEAAKGRLRRGPLIATGSAVLLTAALSVSVFAPAAVADIFRYQDATGAWHFTDDPPPGADADLVPGIATKNKQPSLGDLAARLQEGFDGVTPIARATLSMVTIKSGSGEGAGFFCSSQGHILTNRQLVRPSTSGGFEAREEAVSGQEKEFEALEDQEEDGRQQLKSMKQDLEGYERVIEGARDDRTRSWAQDAHDRLSKKYHSEKAELDKMVRKLRSVSHDLSKIRRDLSWERSSEAVENVFDIVLKDGSELQAMLLHTSSTRDLALLKVDGFRTPYLKIDRPVSITQGETVFAIGNPSGMHDTVTSGVITRIAPDHVLTDAPILPGNGGGPLITADGVVVGINVATDVPQGASMYTAGSGKAISVEIARQEFPDIPSSFAN